MILTNNVLSRRFGKYSFHPENLMVGINLDYEFQFELLGFGAKIEKLKLETNLKPLIVQIVLYVLPQYVPISFYSSKPKLHQLKPSNSEAKFLKNKKKTAAVEAYKASYHLDLSQKELLKKICEITVQLPIHDTEHARYYIT